MKINKFLFGFMLFALVAQPFDSHAQIFKKKKKGDTTEKKEENDFDKKIKDCKQFEGLFNVYQDTTTGNTYMEIDEAQLDREFIYFSHVEDGVLEAGYFRGAYRSSKIITFERKFDHILVYQENPYFYYDEDNALSKAADANINRPVIASLKIEADNKEGRLLVNGDELFLSEAFSMIKPPVNPKSPPFLGNLSKDKSGVESINNYPENTEIRVEYVFDNKNPSRGGSMAVTDVRYVSVVYQHSLLEMPENDFQPRRDDPRLGYFSTQVNDMTTFSATPYRDMIHRWNLVKKDPDAAISEPVEPIVYWIENTTPEEFRPIIKEGIERWNQAFEKAGFRNAVVVKIQPDDAEWDAGDIRYNVVRWTSSPTPPFGGYGPSFVNPRTGQILGADIMLEFVSITNRLFRTEVFELAAMETDAAYEQQLEEFGSHTCTAGEHMHRNMIFGLQAMSAMNIEKAAQEEFVKQTLYRLVLHEVGHTLGLSHNMRGSTMLSPEEIKNAALVNEIGLCNSVMEYPSINYARNKEEQTLYYDTKPGLYDQWIIEYGYSPATENDDAEEARLLKILERSTDPRLGFGNDADDMRASGKGINPDVNIYDLSNDPVAYATERCELVREIMPKIQDTYTVEGQSYHELRNAYYVLTGEYATQIRIMTRQIGGVHFDRSWPEQGGEHAPFEPVSETNQKAAMSALAKYAFAPDAFDEPRELYNFLQGQRRGFNHFAAPEDPKLHLRVLFMQRECLNHLLHQNVLARVTDSQLYGNSYSLDEMMTSLTDAIFKDDLRGSVNTYRQNLQIDYVERLVKIVDEKSTYDNIAQSMAWYELDRIDKMMRSAGSGDTLTRAHRNHVQLLIANAKKA